jgi:glucosamine 6-phosphate synthetase-like amidotransferase/phosphosugar isomerase protein
MCGIFGYSGKRVDSNKLKILALYNESRGGDATGVYSDRRGIIKNIMPVERFISVYNNKFSANSLFLGHTRFRTHGANSIANAHPYRYDNVVGIHNGVLENHDEIALKYNADIEVDSQCIFLAISKNKTHEEDILPEIIGAMAIAYTKSDGQLYLYRRDNPLFVGYYYNSLYFSSLAESLEAIDCKTVYELDENKIYIFKYGKLTNVIEVAEPEIKSCRNWDDYEYSHRDGIPYTHSELFEIGVHSDEIDVLSRMPFNEQDSYLMEAGYYDD